MFPRGVRAVAASAVCPTLSCVARRVARTVKFKARCGPRLNDFATFKAVMVDPLKVFWVLTNSTYLGKVEGYKSVFMW